jgi:sec-independent protein translocase protein TatB
MFEVGFTELLLIFALALLVLGPQKLPKLAQQVGRWVGRARAMARQFRDQLEEEAHSLETKMNVDPGIDTSLDTKKPGSSTSQTSAPAGTPAEPPPPPYTPSYTNDVEEQFYPPDHHMHPGAASQSAESPTGEVPLPAGEGEQRELDLTTGGVQTGIAESRDGQQPPKAS